MAYNLKSIKKKKKKKGIFYTPVELANYLKSFLPENVDEVYDPTCGDGGLLCVFGDDVKKYGQELNEEQLIVAQNRLVNFEGVCGDTLANPAFKGRKFKAIIANPPFGIKWNPPKMDLIDNDERFAECPVMPPAGQADFAFILHILHYLSDDGVAVVMDSTSILWRDKAQGEIRKWFIENNYIDTVVYIPGDQFVDTKIKTCLWILKKNKSNTDIKFINKETSEEKIFTFEQIKKNNFNLHERFYFPEEKIEDTTTINDIHFQMLEDTKGMLRAVIELSRSFSEMGLSILFDDFIHDVEEIIKDAKRSNK